MKIDIEKIKEKLREMECQRAKYIEGQDDPSRHAYVAGWIDALRWVLKKSGESDHIVILTDATALRRKRKLVVELGEEWEKHSKKELEKIFQSLIRAARQKLMTMTLVGRLCPKIPDPVFLGDRALVILTGLFKEGRWRIEDE